MSNPLARLIWGVEPCSSRRRARAWLALVGPGLALLASVGAVWSAGFWLLSRMGAWPRGGDDWSIFLTVSALVGGALGTCVLLLMRCLSERDQRRLIANRQEWHLAGLRGSQMLWGLGGPALIGFGLAAAIHASLAAVCLSWLLADRNLEPGEMALFLVGGFFGATVLMLVGGIFLDVALWAWPPSRVSRLMAMLALGMVSPLLLGILFAPVTGIGDALGQLIIAAEYLSWPVRLWAVSIVWRRATRRLDEGRLG